MALGDDRWIEVSPSQFDHEREGLAIVRELLPDGSPFRAWSNFEFRDSHGRWHEVDLLVLGRAQLHLVELKYYSGVLRGDDHRWLRPGRRAEDSPLKLARRKAQYLAGRLKDEARAWAHESKTQIPDLKQVVPYLQESVFLHHPQLRCELSDHAAQGLYGIDGAEDQTYLPGISELLLEPPRDHRTVAATHERLLPVLMKRLGLVQRREREAGSWVIQEHPIGQGDGWQDWLASHRVVQTDQARIRFRIPPPGSAASVTTELQRIAEHEFRTMSRLHHDGLLGPRDVVESDLGVGLAYPYDAGMQRLDLWLADQQDGLSLGAQLSVIRQIAEAVHYAHGNAVAHRSLSPSAIWVRPQGDEGVKVLVGDWDAAGLAASTPPTGLPAEGVTSIFGAHQAAQAGPDAGDHNTDTDTDTTTFTAPEGTWQATASDRFRLDVFALGALAYYVLTGKPPASSPAALRDKLREQDGLDLSPVLPQVSGTLRGLVLGATHPSPADRTPDLGAFLQALATVERDLTTSAEEGRDPLDATPGMVLEDRFRLERRLGQGSTAVGLLVTDLASATETQRVLKVALDDAAAGRLAEEADVLRRLSSPRLVTLVEGPLVVGGRQALLLESAGEDTLSQVLRTRRRMSLDLLQRYGTDLLEALVALDKAGVDHRDVKPANLGVRTQRPDRAKHLVLFDFSLTRAAASATAAGTPPYLDPFLTGDRNRYDSAAERYAASVVLFEMATGHTPVYGEDPHAHPEAVPHPPTVRADMFDPSVADAMVDFFTTALHREADHRHDTAAEMLRRWQAAFTDDATTVPDNADELAGAATPDTPLAQAGLSARALSALEPLDVPTVGDLVVVDPVRLNQLSGVADATRREVKSRARVWRSAFSDVVRGVAPTGSGTGLPSPTDAADLLLAHTGSRRGTGRESLLRLVLGIGTDLDAFATQAELAAHLPTPVTTARATQLLTSLQDAWAAHEDTRRLLTGIDDVLSRRFTELGGVATTEELVASLVDAMGQGRVAPEAQERRLAAGLLRLMVDRQRALVRAEADVEPVVTRRRDGRVQLLARGPELLDVAESLGREADRLLAMPAQGSTDVLVPADRAVPRLVETLQAQLDDPPAPLSEPTRIVRLAAALSTRSAASGAQELHHRDLPHTRALTLTLGGISPSQRLGAREIRDRVRIRFPALAPLPDRPQLDHLVEASGIGLRYDERDRTYRSTQGDLDTTGLQTRQPTRVAPDTAPVSSAGVIGQRLADSMARRSFLALGVPGHRVERLVSVLRQRYDARLVDLTEVLLAEIRRQAEAAGMKWETVQAADAAPPHSRPAQGLAALVARAVPAVTASIEALMADDTASSAPVVLTEASTLARYDHLGELTRWTDLSRSRGRAIWLLVPQLRESRGSMIDGHPVSLNSPGQFLPLDSDWIDTQDQVLSSTSQPTTTGAQQ